MPLYTCILCARTVCIAYPYVLHIHMYIHAFVCCAMYDVPVSPYTHERSCVQFVIASSHTGSIVWIVIWCQLQLCIRRVHSCLHFSATLYCITMYYTAYSVCYGIRASRAFALTVCIVYVLSTVCSMYTRVPCVCMCVRCYYLYVSVWNGIYACYAPHTRERLQLSIACIAIMQVTRVFAYACVL